MWTIGLHLICLSAGNFSHQILTTFPFGFQQVLSIDMTSKDISLHNFISLTWRSTLAFL